MCIGALSAPILPMRSGAFQESVAIITQQPQFLCSSATIANPVELAEKICGAHFSCIDRNGAGAEEREYCLVQPPKITGKDKSYYGQKSVVDTTVELLPEILNEGKSFIAFAKSRKNVEIILKETRDRLEGAGFLGTGNKDQILRLPGRLYAGGKKSHRRKNDLR